MADKAGTQSRFSQTPADLAYQSQGKHRRPDSSSTDTPPDSGTTKKRPVIQRIEYVFDKIIEALPDSMRSDWRYAAVKTVMKESIKDLELIPDEAITPIMREFSAALAFVADGDMADIDDS